MSDDYREAYLRLLKENTKLNASVQYWRGLAMTASANAMEENREITRMYENCLNGIKIQLKRMVENKSLLNDLLSMTDEFRPLIVQSRAAKNDTRL